MRNTGSVHEMRVFQVRKSIIAPALADLIVAVPVSEGEGTTEVGGEEAAMRQISAAVDKKKDDHVTSHDTPGGSGSRHVADDDKYLDGGKRQTKHGTFSDSHLRICNRSRQFSRTEPPMPTMLL